nr:reverse transcriptase domain-containing protein [Tanacetum cinerariifolium]
MANTTLIVVTVTRTATKEKVLNEAETAPRINILDFCEEYYTDILLVMNRIHHDKQREAIKGRAYSTDLAILTRQAQLNPNRTRKIPGIVLMVEAALTGGTLLTEIVHRVETAPAASKNHMITSTLPTGQAPNIDIAPTTETAPVERWAMPTWCHMFNSTLIGAVRIWFDELPPKRIDGYKDLKAAFLSYFMQQKKYVKDPVEIYNIKQRDGEPLRTSWNDHGRNDDRHHCLHTRRSHRRWKKEKSRIMENTGPVKRHTSEKRFDFRGQPREGRGSSRLPPSRTPKEILAARGRKVPAATTYGTPLEKRSSNKFYDFHSDKGHSTDECMQLKREIMIPSLTNSSGTKGPLVIEAKIGGHMIHRMYVDGGSSTEVLYEHCFNQLRPEVKNQMVPATTSLTGFSRETIWPLGQLRLLVTIGDADHSTRAWMNFMIVRSLSLYNRIIRRPGIKEIHVVPSTAHGMLKFLTDGGIVTIRSTILIPAECAMMITSSKEIPKEAGVHYENFKVALHLNFPDQEVAIGGTLSAKGRIELCSLLKENLDIFAWKPSDVTGVPRLVVEHQLNIQEGYSPVRQKKKG